MAITFRGVTLMDDDEGGCDFEPPDFGPVPVIEPLPRGLGGLAKDVGSPPAPWRLTLRFHPALADVATIRARIAAARSVVPGDLEVPDEGTIPNCLITNATRQAQKRITNPAGEAGQRMIYVIEGVQLLP